MKKNQRNSFMFFTVILSVGILSLFDSDRQFERLQVLFHNFEYEQTILLANKILADTTISKQEKIQTYIIKGVSEFSSNQTLKARKTFMELILFDKNVVLDKKEVSPKIIDFFNQLKTKLALNSI